jgi:hypothetical protein
MRTLEELRECPLENPANERNKKEARGLAGYGDFLHQQTWLLERITRGGLKTPEQFPAVRQRHGPLLLLTYLPRRNFGAF